MSGHRRHPQASGVLALALGACSGGAAQRPVTSADPVASPDARRAAVVDAAPLAPSPDAPPDAAPPPDAPPPCVIAPPRRAVDPAYAKHKARRHTVAVFDIVLEHGACRVRYADGDNEDSMAAAAEICAANPCLAPGEMFDATVRVVTADLPCNGLSFCDDPNGTYASEYVVELTPR